MQRAKLHKMTKDSQQLKGKEVFLLSMSFWHLRYGIMSEVMMHENEVKWDLWLEDIQ